LAVFSGDCYASILDAGGIIFSTNEELFVEISDVRSRDLCARMVVLCVNGFEMWWLFAKGE
jgi:hypothetical protein